MAALAGVCSPGPARAQDGWSGGFGMAAGASVQHRADGPDVLGIAFGMQASRRVAPRLHLQAIADASVNHFGKNRDIIVDCAPGYSSCGDLHYDPHLVVAGSLEARLFARSSEQGLYTLVGAGVAYLHHQPGTMSPRFHLGLGAEYPGPTMAAFLEARGTVYTSRRDAPATQLHVLLGLRLRLGAPTSSP
ncbi:MAG: hypothetical protein HOP28_16180 [Gemmatimonadales bacterium]|nr:hypothetical protein [Gemmatimonadales bacterium]